MKFSNRILLVAAGAAALAFASFAFAEDETAGNPTDRALLIANGSVVKDAAPLPVKCISGCAAGTSTQLKDSGGTTIDPATAAKQDTAAGKLDTLHTDLATTLHGDLTPLATAAAQTTAAGKLDTLHTDLATTLHGDLTPLATAAAQTTAAGKLDTLHTDLGTTIHGDLTAATPAGENHVGEVGSNLVKVTATPTVTSGSAYASNNVVGSLLTFSGVGRVSSGTGLIQSVTLEFKSSQTASTDFVWCGADNPTNTTLTDKSAVALSTSDFNKCRVIHITDCTNLGTPSVCDAENLALPFSLSSSTTGYGFLVTRGTPTFSSTSDVEVQLRILRN
ncbi:MAG: hypothetical protein WCA78_00670 [Rhizomicrobium sp.]